MRYLILTMAFSLSAGCSHRVEISKLNVDKVSFPEVVGIVGKDRALRLKSVPKGDYLRVSLTSDIDLVSLAKFSEITLVLSNHHRSPSNKLS